MFCHEVNLIATVYFHYFNETVLTIDVQSFHSNAQILQTAASGFGTILRDMEN